jgi:integrase
MSESQFGAQGASSATQAAVTPAPAPSSKAPNAGKKAARKQKSARAQAYKTAAGTWSGRVRRKGVDIFLSGYASQNAMEEELNKRVAALAQRGKPYGAGPERTTVAKAMQDHALKHLTSLKGAEQEARRINKYLRAARLATLEVCLMGDVSSGASVPKNAQTGMHHAVWLKQFTGARAIPKGLGNHRKQLLTRTAGSDRIRTVIANTKMAEVSYELLQDLVRQLEAEGFAKATVQQEVALLKRLFYHASEKWHWPAPARNPALPLKLAGELTKRERVMSHEEQTRLDEALQYSMNGLLAPATEFATETAMRAEEFLSATWGAVNWEACLLHLEDAKAGKRDVPLSERAIEILQALGPSEDPKQKIFGITYEALKAGWRRACERAGITDLRIQDLRHTAATRMALKCGNIFIVQQLTGHKTFEMVTRYVNVKAADVVKVMRMKQPPAPAGEPAAQSAAAAPVPAAMTPETLQAAMQMLQAAAAQLTGQSANVSPSPARIPAPPAANDDAGDMGAVA